MKKTIKKVTQMLIFSTCIMLLSTSAFADLKNLTDIEMKGITAQSGLVIALDDEMTDEEKQEEAQRQQAIQVIMALSKMVPSDLIREVHGMHTVQGSIHAIQHFNTMHEGLIAVPSFMTTVITMPVISLGISGGGGFF